MIKSLNINENLEKYIRENSYDLHPVQKDIIEYNKQDCENLHTLHKWLYNQKYLLSN